MLSLPPKKKLFYFSIEPNKSSVEYLRLLTLLTHDVITITGAKGIRDNKPDIVRSDTTLMFTASAYENFIQLNEELHYMSDYTGSQYVEVGQFWLPMDTIGKKLVYVGRKYDNMPQSVERFPASNLIPEKYLNQPGTVTIVYSFIQHDIAPVMSKQNKGMVLPILIDENPCRNDMRLMDIELFKKRFHPEFHFAIGPKNQRMMNLFIHTRRKFIFVWLSDLKELKKYPAFKDPSKRCQISYPAQLTEVVKQHYNFTEVTKKFKPIDDLLEDQASAMSDQTKLELSKLGVSHPDPYIRYSYKKVSVCVHSNLLKEFSGSDLQAKLVRGEQFCKNKYCDIHVYRQNSEYGEIPQGTHLVLNPERLATYPQVKYNATTVDDLIAQTYNEVAFVKMQFQCLRVIVVEDRRLYSMVEDMQRNDMSVEFVQSLSGGELNLQDRPFAVVFRDGKTNLEVLKLEGLRFIIIRICNEHYPKDLVKQNCSIYRIKEGELMAEEIGTALRGHLTGLSDKSTLTYRLNKQPPLVYEYLNKTDYQEEEQVVNTLNSIISSRDCKPTHRAIIVDQDSVYAVLKQAKENDHLFYLCEYPRMWKELYNRNPCIKVVSSELRKLLAPTTAVLDVPFKRGLHRKENRVPLKMVYDLTKDNQVSVKFTQIYKSYFFYKSIEMREVGSVLAEGEFFILLIKGSDYPEFISNVAYKLSPRHRVFVYETVDIGRWLTEFSCLKQISIVSSKLTELLGELSYYCESKVAVARAREYLQKGRGGEGSGEKNQKAAQGMPIEL